MNEVGSHHGDPVLSKREFETCLAMIEWINTVREQGKKDLSYPSDWLPSAVDLLKSRLFWRIRSGKKPLLHAPPTAYSCPWYEVIEESDHAHWCYDDVHFIEPGDFYHRNDTQTVSIAQCMYSVEKQIDDKTWIVSFRPYEFTLVKGTKTVQRYRVDSGADLVEVQGFWLQLITKTD